MTRTSCFFPCRIPAQSRLKFSYEDTLFTVTVMLYL